jgi:hypothetical protein
VRECVIVWLCAKRCMEAARADGLLGASLEAAVRARVL